MLRSFEISYSAHALIWSSSCTTCIRRESVKINWRPAIANKEIGKKLLESRKYFKTIFKNENKEFDKNCGRTEMNSVLQLADQVLRVWYRTLLTPPFGNQNTFSGYWSNPRYHSRTTSSAVLKFGQLHWLRYNSIVDNPFPFHRLLAMNLRKKKSKQTKTRTNKQANKSKGENICKERKQKSTKKERLTVQLFNKQSVSFRQKSYHSN